MRNFDPKIEYIETLFAQESEELKNIKKFAQSDGVEGMQISAFEGKLLSFLVGLCKARKVVEIGSLFGYSTFWMSQALPEDGQIYALEKDAARAEQIRKNFADTSQEKKLKVY